MLLGLLASLISGSDDSMASLPLGTASAGSKGCCNGRSQCQEHPPHHTVPILDRFSSQSGRGALNLSSGSSKSAVEQWETRKMSCNYCWKSLTFQFSTG